MYGGSDNASQFLFKIMVGTTISPSESWFMGGGGPRGAPGGGREGWRITDLSVLCLPGRRGIGHGERHAEHAEATEGGKHERVG